MKPNPNPKPAHLVRELLLEVGGEAGVVEALLVHVASVPHGHGRLPLLHRHVVLVDDARRRDPW